MDKILIGRKGKDIEPGYIWAPYILAESKPVVVDGYNLYKKSRFYESIPQKRSRKIKSILENVTK